MPHIAQIPKIGKHRSSFTLREKVEMVARCKVKGEDPASVVPKFYQARQLEPPKHPAQPLSGFIKFIQNRLASDDPETIALAREYGIEVTAVSQSGD